VIDLTEVSSQDGFNHSKFAESEVVKTIGARRAGNGARSASKPSGSASGRSRND
jgi:esterase/lipase superfamily enzyme